MKEIDPPKTKSLLITGGAGFIGSHLVRHFVRRYPEMTIVCLDALTYAGNIANIEDLLAEPNCRLVVADVADYQSTLAVMRRYDVEGVIHLAAESHVDRSIEDPFAFARTNVLGTLALLEAFRQYQAQTDRRGRFYQVSTDEVYGSLSPMGDAFSEATPYAPRSPYSAAKASADHFVRSYGETYGLDVVISCCSNNFGPSQFPEKLIPLFIQNILLERPLPVYGQGENVRDWLYVLNHIEAIEAVFFRGRSGETYNIGGGNEWKNIDLVKRLIAITDRQLGRREGVSERLITYVPDRLGHDLRYAIDPTKIKRELGWSPRYDFESSLESTVAWYLASEKWREDIRSGAYMQQNDRARELYSL